MSLSADAITALLIKSKFCKKPARWFDRSAGNLNKLQSKNFTECDGDVFGLDVISISFGKGSWQDTTYQINLSVDPKSPVYKTIDMNDWEEIMTLYGQIEGCVENKLNDIIYNKYGCFTSHVLITST